MDVDNGDRISEIQSDVPIDVDAVSNGKEDPIWKRARLSLKQYLEV